MNKQPKRTVKARRIDGVLCRRHPRFSSVYVSSFGHVYFLSKDKPAKLLRVQRSWNGYHTVRLFIAGKGVDRRVSRIILEAFRGPCPEGHQASHLNGIRTDNRLANLAWETVSKNCSRKKQHGTAPRHERNALAKLTNQQAREIIAREASGDTIRPLAREYGISPRSVYSLCRGFTWIGLTPLPRPSPRAPKPKKYSYP